MTITVNQYPRYNPATALRLYLVRTGGTWRLRSVVDSKTGRGLHKQVDFFEDRDEAVLFAFRLADEMGLKRVVFEINKWGDNR